MAAMTRHVNTLAQEGGPRICGMPSRAAPARLPLAAGLDDGNVLATQVMAALARQEAILGRMSQQVDRAFGDTLYPPARQGEPADANAAGSGGNPSGGDLPLRRQLEQHHFETCDRLEQLRRYVCPDEEGDPSDEADLLNENSKSFQRDASPGSGAAGQSQSSANAENTDVILPSICTVVGMKARLATFFQSGTYDLCIGIVVSLNMVSMLIESQFTGYEAAEDLGLRTNEFNVDMAKSSIGVIDAAFNAIYLMEILLRLAVLPFSQFRETAVVIDAIVVIVCCVEGFILQNMDVSNSWYLSLARLLGLRRIFRIMRLLKSFAELRILLRVMSLTGDALCWGMLLVVVIMSGCSIALASLTQGFITNESNDPDLRRWAYYFFGSSTHAWWTLFEATFTGTWPRFARQSIDDISPLFAIFWALYIMIVNFAVTRVIAAMFLKQTMAVANADAETVAMEAMKRKDMYTSQLRQIFSLADTDGGGSIDKQEFKVMMQNEEVLALFMQLDLSADEVETLFRVLSHESGEADYNEFLDGAMRMKSSARAIDAIVIQHELAKLFKLETQVASAVNALKKDGHRRSHRQASHQPAHGAAGL